MNIYKSDKEIQELKDKIKARELDRKSQEEIRKDLLNHIKPSRSIRLEKWFNRNLGWFFTNGRKQVNK